MYGWTMDKRRLFKAGTAVALIVPRGIVESKQWQVGDFINIGWRSDGILMVKKHCQPRETSLEHEKPAKRRQKPGDCLEQLGDLGAKGMTNFENPREAGSE